jgi:hypothetical protein
MTVMTGVIAWITIEVAAPFQHAHAASIGYAAHHRSEVRRESPPPNFSPKNTTDRSNGSEMPRQTPGHKPILRRPRNSCQPIRGRIVGNVVRVRALFFEWKISNHCSAAQPRHYGGPARIISSDRAGKLNAGRFCSLTAGIREHCSLSLRYSSTAQEDVLCGDHNGVAPKRH